MPIFFYLHPINRALNSIKLGSGFELFTLLGATFLLAQSKLVIGIFVRKFCPDLVIVLLRQFVAPYWPKQLSFSQTGIAAFLLISLFRYLILDNVRKSRSKGVLLEKNENKTPQKSSEPAVEAKKYAEDTSIEKTGNIREISRLKILLKEQKCDLMSDEEVLELLKVGAIRTYALEKALGESVIINRHVLDFYYNYKTPLIFYNLRLHCT